MRGLAWVYPMLLLAGCGDYTDELPGNYHYYSEGSDDSVIVPKDWQDGEAYIPCNIEAFKVNEDFIIARQRAKRDCFWQGRNPLNQELNVEYFWIIDAAQDQIYGPYEKSAYQKKSKDMGVPEELDLTHK